VLQSTDPVEVAERRDQVLSALDRLNPDQRAALVLVDMQGYSVEEAATILGCAPGTVKSRCARGRAKLVPLLAALREPQSKGGDPPGPPPRAQRHPGAREAERGT
jgi:RNA polymerase sigma-70 factor (ECF subfamily)